MIGMNCNILGLACSNAYMYVMPSKKYIHEKEYYTSLTAPQDAYTRLVLQVYFTLAQTPLSQCYVGKSLGKQSSLLLT